MAGRGSTSAWVSSATVGNWRDRFVDAGKAGMDRSLPGPDGGQSQTERRLRHECEQLKLALAEATVQLRIWQKGSEFVDAVPSPAYLAVEHCD
jgi:transposase